MTELKNMPQECRGHRVSFPISEIQSCFICQSINQVPGYWTLLYVYSFVLTEIITTLKRYKIYKYPVSHKKSLNNNDVVYSFKF